MQLQELLALSNQQLTNTTNAFLLHKKTTLISLLRSRPIEKTDSLLLHYCLEMSNQKKSKHCSSHNDSIFWPELFFLRVCLDFLHSFVDWLCACTHSHSSSRTEVSTQANFALPSTVVCYQSENIHLHWNFIKYLSLSLMLLEFRGLLYYFKSTQKYSEIF